VIQPCSSGSAPPDVLGPRFYHLRSAKAENPLRQNPPMEVDGDRVYVAIFAVLFLAWLAGVVVFQLATSWIHLLFVLAALSLIAHLFQRKTVS